MGREGIVPEHILDAEHQIPLYVHPDELSSIRENYSIVKTTFECEVLTLSELLQDEPDESPYFATIFLCIDQTTGILLDFTVDKRMSIAQHAQKTLVQLFKQIKGIPSTIYIDNNDTYVSLLPIAAELNIELEEGKLTKLKKARKEVLANSGLEL